MPDPQRGASLRILIAEARAADVPPAMLVTHLPHAEEMRYTVVRARVMRRISDEVEGMTMKMLARAFRRNPRRVKDFLDGVYSKKNASGQVIAPQDSK